MSLTEFAAPDPSGAAFTAHYQALAAHARWGAARLAARHPLAEFDDLCQVGLLRAWQASERVAHLPPHEQLWYLRRVVSNGQATVLRRFKRTAPHAALVEEAAGAWPDARRPDPVEFAAVLARYPRVTRRQREAMTLVYFHDLSVKAAAARLGAKPASVSNRIQRALAVIREGGRSAF